MLSNISSMFVRLYIYTIPLILFYTVSKKHDENKCNELTKQSVCSNEQIDTKITLRDKLKKLISFSNNVTFWKKYYIMATLICVVILIFIPDVKEHILVALHIIIFFILYFYKLIIKIEKIRCRYNKIGIN